MTAGRSECQENSTFLPLVPIESLRSSEKGLTTAVRFCIT